MTSWSNFPASGHMTDFEIVSIQSEMTRNNRRLEEQREQERRENILIVQGHAENNEVPPLINHPAFEPPLVNLPAQPPILPQEHIPMDAIMEEQEEDRIDTEEEVWEDAASSISPKSRNTSLLINEQSDFNEDVNFLPIRIQNNTTEFMDELNALNMARGKQTIILSSIRPNFQSNAHHDFFLCHICQVKPLVIPWWRERIKDGLDYDLKFAYNFGAIIHHIKEHHCNIKVGPRHMVKPAENYIAQINWEIPQISASLAEQTISIPKSSSTTCLDVTWKSNQTNLTKILANSYDFYGYNKKCIGHTKRMATTGCEYELDLADSVYCSCGRPTIQPVDFDLNLNLDLDFENLTKRTPPYVVSDPDISQNYDDSFFDQKGRSIQHVHKTIIVCYKLKMKSLRPFSHKTTKPTKPTTREDSRKERERKDKDDQPDEKKLQQDNKSNDITTMVAHMVQAITTASFDPAILCPASAIAQEAPTGIRQEPDGSDQFDVVPRPPTALRARREYNKGGGRTPANGFKAIWPHERPAFKARAAAAAAAAVNLLNPGAQSVRLSDVKF